MVIEVTTNPVATANRNVRRKKAASEAKRASDSAPAPPPDRRARWSRVGLCAAALAYFATVWLDGIGSAQPAKYLPRIWVYFAQIAALFKNAGLAAVDYRAEGWMCSERKWVEIDVRPYFEIDADNKENRFQRALQFHRRDRKVMRALEDYIVKHYNDAHAASPVAGVRFSSLRVPYPAPGAHVDRYERKPLASFPREMKHDWYFTPQTRRAEKCGTRHAIPKDGDEEKKTPPPPDEPSKDFAP